MIIDSLSQGVYFQSKSASNRVILVKMIMYERLVFKINQWLQRKSVDYYMSKMKIGHRVAIKRGLKVSKPRNVTIGNDVRINVDVIIQAHAPIIINEFTMIAARYIIVTANHDISKSGIEAFDTIKTAPVIIGKNCWLGTGVIVLPGVTIGDDCVIGAGSVVTHDLPQGMICVGSPAEPIKNRPLEEVC